MAAAIDSPVIRELVAILEGVDHFPQKFTDSDFETCRASKRDNKGRCGVRIAEEKKKKVKDLLSLFQVMTKCVDTNALYDEMQRFISFTHCPKNHGDDALEAFNRWKILRQAAISNARPITPPRSATSYNVSFESVSSASSMGSSSFASNGLEDDEPSLDSYIAEKIKGLEIATAAQDAPIQTGESGFAEIEIEKEIFKSLGDVRLPTKGKKHDDEKIAQAIKSCLGSTNMDAGLLYVLEHTKISGLFKIGWSRVSAKQRFKKNCFKNETMLRHSTQGQTIIGAFQAEKIAHAILHHKNIEILKCSLCGKSHKEWFLVSRKEALDAVILAEQWLKMPAYGLKLGEYALTPKAVDIHGSMFPFSISKMEVLMNLVKKSDDTSGVFPEAPSTATVRETTESSVSPTSVESMNPRVLISESPDITPSLLYGMRESSPLGGLGVKGDVPFIQTEEIYETRSREITPDGEYEIVKRIVRTKVSQTNIKEDSTVYEYSEPAVLDDKDNEPRKLKHWISKAKNKMAYKSRSGGS